MRTINLDDFIENPEDMALCPLCDSIIERYEEVDIIIAYGCKSLAHTMCVDNELEEDE